VAVIGDSGSAPAIPDYLDAQLAPTANKFIETAKTKADSLSHKVASLEDQYRRVLQDLAIARHEYHYFKSIIAAGTRFTEAHDQPTNS